MYLVYFFFYIKNALGCFILVQLPINRHDVSNNWFVGKSSSEGSFISAYLQPNSIIFWEAPKVEKSEQ